MLGEMKANTYFKLSSVTTTNAMGSGRRHLPKSNHGTRALKGHLQRTSSLFSLTYDDQVIRFVAHMVTGFSSEWGSMSMSHFGRCSPWWCGFL